ncbi:MAG: T9SS type A sorting domain-containing protein, partial [Flavobacteriales bacterium]|nr:T9SS type A sorting domain-containing protein [Flavobacteriales bacterium]
RNSTGAAYPYNIGALASITGHKSPNSATYHYFFYNLQLQENCKSNYTEVTAVLSTPLNTPIITQNGNQLSTISNSSYSYQWYLNGVIINGANSNTINITQAGIYKVEINYNGCDVSSADYTAIYTGLDEEIHQIVVHPNPLKGMCEISSDMPMESISIMDVSGKLLFKFLGVNAFEFYLDLSELNNGIYFAKVTTANASTEHKLILQK